MFTKKIWFSGGDFHELQKLFAMLPGVLKVRTGYINPEGEPNYDDVLSGAVPAVLGVMVEYNPKKTDISQLMDIMFAVIDPYSDKQGRCEGAMYQSGVYYNHAEDEPQIELHMNFIATRGKPPATGACITLNDPNSDPRRTRVLHAVAKRLTKFVEAEDEHQNLLERYPNKPTNIDFARFVEYVKL